MKKISNLPKKISVFPLSNFIIFPNTSVPLNIFEPRYIEMINESMKTDRIIGIIQPKERKKNISKLYTVGCAGKITNFNETNDGKSLVDLINSHKERLEKKQENINKIAWLKDKPGASQVRWIDWLIKQLNQVENIKQRTFYKALLVLVRCKLRQEEK